MSIINQHDWSDVEEWFEARASLAGHSKYEHVESIFVPINECSAVTEFAKRCTETIDNLFAEEAPNTGEPVETPTEEFLQALASSGVRK